MASELTTAQQSVPQASQEAPANQSTAQGPITQPRKRKNPQPHNYASTSGPYKMDELVRAGVIRVGDELKYQSKDNINCTVMVRGIGKAQSLNVAIAYNPLSPPNTLPSGGPPQPPTQKFCDDVKSPSALEDAIAGTSLGPPRSRRNWDLFCVVHNGENLGTLAHLRNALVEERNVRARSAKEEGGTAEEGKTGTRSVREVELEEELKAALQFGHDALNLIQSTKDSTLLPPPLHQYLSQSLIKMQASSSPEFWAKVTDPEAAGVNQGEDGQRMDTE